MPGRFLERGHMSVTFSPKNGKERGVPAPENRNNMPAPEQRAEVAAPENGNEPDTNEPGAPEQVLLGQTGLSVSRAGFGVLPMGPAQLALPVEEGALLISYALDAGINFFDTAQYYRTYPYLRMALQKRDSSPSLHTTAVLGARRRSEPVICSKSLAVDYDGMMAAIEEARRELDRDVIDIFLMHEVRTGQLPQRARAWEALQDARARGWIRACGLSTHHVNVAAAAAGIRELDVMFPLLNYAGLGIRTCDIQSGNMSSEVSGQPMTAEAAGTAALSLESGAQTVSSALNSAASERFASAEEMLQAIRLCNQAGKGIFTMKAFGGGSLTAHYQKALNYVFGQTEIQSVMIGFGRISEIDDLLSYLSGHLSPAYNPDVSHKRIHINQEDCEGCGACRAVCPAGAIFWNAAGLAEVDQSRCLTCGYCTPACPVRAVIMY